jgi:RNA polymerase sigma-70 factor (ECF subfamily)
MSGVEGVDHDQVVAWLQAGDPRGFDGAWACFRAPIYGYLLRMCRDRALAEELLQETFLRLARSGPRLLPGTRLQAWLYTVARNLWLNQRRWSWLDGTALVARLGFAWGSPDEPGQLLEADELQRQIEAAVGELSEANREVFVLVCLEGLSLDEAAEVLQLKPEALRQRLSRARAQVAARLGPGAVG